MRTPGQRFSLPLSILQRRKLGEAKLRLLPQALGKCWGGWTPGKPIRAPPPGSAPLDLHFHKFHVPPSATLHPADVIEANYLVQKNRERISSCLCPHNRGSNKELQLPLSPAVLISDQLSSASQGRTGPAKGKLCGQCDSLKTSRAGAQLWVQSP